MADILSDLIASMKDNIASVDKEGMINSVVSIFYCYLRKIFHYMCFLLLLLTLFKWYFVLYNIHVIFSLKYVLEKFDFRAKSGTPYLLVLFSILGNVLNPLLLKKNFREAKILCKPTN